MWRVSLSEYWVFEPCQIEPHRLSELNRLEEKRQKPKSEEEKDSDERDKDNKKKAAEAQPQPEVRTQRLRRAYHHMLDSSKPFQPASHPPDTGAEESAPFVGHWRQHVQFLRARQAEQMNGGLDDDENAGIGRVELKRGGGINEWKWNGR